MRHRRRRPWCSRCSRICCHSAPPTSPSPGSSRASPCSASPSSDVPARNSAPSPTPHEGAFRFPPAERMIEPVAEIFDHIDELRRSSGRVAVATLVNTHGTTPRKEGAKMVVGEGGAILGSVTIGGCVDAQVIEQAEDVLTTMRPRLLEMNLGDEEAWEIGLTCGGTIEVFVEPLAADFLDRVRAHTERGGRAAIVTRLDGPVGAKLLLLDDGTTAGSLGDVALDARVAHEAREPLAAGTSRWSTSSGSASRRSSSASIHSFPPPRSC